MFTAAIREGLIEPAHSVQVGIRTWNPDRRAMTIIDAPRVHDAGPDAIAEEIIEVVADRPAYLTFDIDCLDPSFAPGTGTPVIGGLSTHQPVTILRALGGIDWVGMYVVEVAPAYDQAEITALAGATLAHDRLSLVAQRRRDHA